MKQFRLQEVCVIEIVVKCRLEIVCVVCIGLSLSGGYWVEFGLKKEGVLWFFHFIRVLFYAILE